ncbi:MAG TPA: hypothetical protein VH701_26520 [Vicinamibacterales bacterium]
MRAPNALFLCLVLILLSDSLVGMVLGAGQNLRSHQVRSGLGVRF